MPIQGSTSAWRGTYVIDSVNRAPYKPWFTDLYVTVCIWHGNSSLHVLQYLSMLRVAVFAACVPKYTTAVGTQFIT